MVEKILLIDIVKNIDWKDIPAFNQTRGEEYIKKYWAPKESKKAETPTRIFSDEQISEIRRIAREENIQRGGYVNHSSFLPPIYDNFVIPHSQITVTKPADEQFIKIKKGLNLEL